MAVANPFRVEGVIVSVWQRGVYQVELANGHRLLGYVVRRERDALSVAGLGDHVEVELSPYDLSKGRVRLKKETER